MGDEQGHHLSCWAEGIGPSFTPGQSRRGLNTQGTDSLSHVRGQGEGHVLYIGLLLGKNSRAKGKGLESGGCC